MSTYDNTSPAQAHQALSDVDKILANTDALRNNESSAEASPPNNPVAGQWWHTSDTDKWYVRTNSGAWQYLFRVSDLPVMSSDLTAHTGANITSSTTVHGIRQGSGNGLDADMVDGYHASSFLQSSHATSTSGIHGAGSGVLLSAPTTTPFLVIASTAPTGWTQSTSWNDRVIRIVSSTGGGTGGSWTITGINPEGAHYHSTPNHWHYIAGYGGTSDGNYPSPVYRYNGGLFTAGGGAISATGAYDFTETSGGANTGVGVPHAHTFNGAWRPSYLDVIAVTKNA